MNYFEIFGLTASFSVELNALTTTYQTIQKTVHPDRFAHASAQEQLLAAKKSTLVNDAYQTLKNPLKRAEYLLSLRGVEMPNEQASFGDTMFLMRQMELREMLDDIQHAGDQNQALLDASEELDQEYETLFHQLTQAIEENSESSNQAATEMVRKLKFYQKLHVELERIEDQLFDD